MHDYERNGSAGALLQAAAVVAYYTILGAVIKRLITNNDSASRSKLLAKTSQALGLKHTFKRSYRPQNERQG